jgi:hypothetical protein
MNTVKSTSALIVCAGMCVGALGLGAARLAARGQDKKAIATAAAAKLSGTWQLNEALSTAASTGLMLPKAPPPPPKKDAVGSASENHSIQTKPSSTGGGVSHNGPSDKDMAELNALIDEIRLKPEKVTIDATASTVTLTFPDSARKLKIDDKKKVKVGEQNLPAVAKWDGDVLVVSMNPVNSPETVLNERYQVTPDGNLMVWMTLQTSGVKRVYEKAK